MAEFTLRERPKKTLKVNIGDESFEIPLAGSLTPEEAAPLDTQAGTIEFFQKYLSEEVKHSLVIDDYNELTKAWIKASKVSGGKSAGE